MRSQLSRLGLLPADRSSHERERLHAGRRPRGNTGRAAADPGPPAPPREPDGQRRVLPNRVRRRRQLPDLQLPASRTVRQHSPAASGHPVCGPFLRQPQETHTRNATGVSSEKLLSDKHSKGNRTLEGAPVSRDVPLFKVFSFQQKLLRHARK